MAEDFASDEDLLAIRGNVANLIGRVMRAWNAGMVAARSPDEERLMARIVLDISPVRRSPEPPELDEDGHPVLTRLPDEQYLLVVSAMLDRIAMLREAYERGMISARTPEQEVVMDELREAFD